MEIEEKRNLHEEAANTFIEYCIKTFNWSDLSEDEIMDVGCGEEGFAGKAILARFPKTKSVIGIDCSHKVACSFRQKNESKMQIVVAEIQDSVSLEKYHGQMSKVVSTHVFHMLQEKEGAFGNVYRLLKPGGEAAILFVIKSSIYEWLMEILKIQKWKNAYQRFYVDDHYNKGLGTDDYIKMVKSLGFQVVDFKEELNVTPYESDEECKEEMYRLCESNFKVYPAQIDEFKETCLQVLVKVSGRNEEGKVCFRSTHLSLLLTKPIKVASKPK